jgi:dihydrofolate synthase/folylpolyglutamate synthase
MQKLSANVTVDVGHNTLAAEAISRSFSKETSALQTATAGFGEKSVNLVYNSYRDKDYLSILAILEPIVKEVHIIELNDERVVSKEDLISAIKKNGLQYRDFNMIDKNQDYLVFGSFLVVEAFKKYF